MFDPTIYGCQTLLTSASESTTPTLPNKNLRRPLSNTVIPIQSTQVDSPAPAKEAEPEDSTVFKVVSPFSLYLLKYLIII